MSAEEKERELEQNRLEREALEKLDPDEYHGWRIHSWVAIISNAWWVVKKSIVVASEDEIKDVEPRAFFIEPSTGCLFETNDPNYLGIESVWNQYNYYVSTKKQRTKIC